MYVFLLARHKYLISADKLTGSEQIGGSLIKLCYWSFEEDTEETGGRLNFRKFPTDRIDACIEFMKRLTAKHRKRNGGGDNAGLYVVATGGGAYKFYDQIKSALGVEVMREDEMECLIIGTVMLHNIQWSNRAHCVS
jgi:type II pantothenate kinase